MKKIVYSIIGLILIFTCSEVYGQISGSPAEHVQIEATISEIGAIHVVHEIRKNNEKTFLNTFVGNVTDLQIIDEDGNNLEHETISGDSMGILLPPSKSNLFIEYELDEVLNFKDGVWRWDIRYPATVTIHLPDKIDLAFANYSPVRLEDNSSVRCHGCQIILEYSFDESIKYEKIKWEDQEFQLYIRSLAGIQSFDFDQPSKSISFEVIGDNQFVTLIIPLELLWQPYEVFLGEQKILKHEFLSNQTHAWLNIRPETSGTVTIIGTSVVPEFPLFGPLVVGIGMVIVFQLKKKITLH